MQEMAVMGDACEDDAEMLGCKYADCDASCSTGRRCHGAW